jgi:ribosomal protein S12 methylthiotransferase accessory factor YcaO
MPMTARSRISASGKTEEKATLSGLFECIERNAVFLTVEAFNVLGREFRRVDLSIVPDASELSLISHPA